MALSRMDNDAWRGWSRNPVVDKYDRPVVQSLVELEPERNHPATDTETIDPGVK
ncbi:hypothetical protein ZHAS_00010758 [Anopheles sinensis]|uniref:Uncharacterized protein n=1 Tax=Anopheles sinensis TaxID=74873 RepID=A0A084VYN3_ANOSI|nr:hypothetical protein ZHAS_00010758 [Anopheles sinensis]